MSQGHLDKFCLAVFVSDSVSHNGNCYNLWANLILRGNNVSFCCIFIPNSNARRCCMILTCYFTVNVRFYVVTALKLGQFVGPPHEATVC